MNDFEYITENLAIKDIAELEAKGSKYFRETRSGNYSGHYSKGEFFFFQMGKEIFRTSNKSLAIKWLRKTYRGH
jgi:hypothetical protein